MHPSAKLPEVQLHVVVDDLTISVDGQPGDVAQQLVRLTALCIDDLESELDMSVSRGAKWMVTEDVKSVAVASDAGTRKLITTGLKALGILVKTQARNLGVDYALGRKAKRKHAWLNRWSKVKAKVKRCKQIGPVAASMIGRTALIPAVSYGASCASVATGLLSDIRGVIASLHGPMNGRSTTARLSIRGMDLAFPLVLAPLWAGRRAVWTEALPRDVLEAALRRASRNARNAGHLIHACAEGGAGAFISSLSRVG